ncbi:MAG: hypothetical protein QCI38_02510 [Candidatus Thermoplasmatota archaeon]|nr:hypothetical protein [Candidatus Thermoplasmatota archaeon]
MSDSEKERTERKNAEKRYTELVERRDELNAQARACFEARNTLNDEKRRLYDELQALNDQRKKVGDDMTLHKRRRDEYQGAAKQLIGQKQTKRKDVHKNLPGDIGAIKAELRLLEIKQETTPLSLAKERALLDEMKSKREELARLEALFGKQSVVVGELDDIDKSIDELFAKGDEEHQIVLTLGKEIKEIREKMDTIRKEVTHLAAEATKKHEEGLVLRDEATKIHNKTLEMREKILVVKKERWAEQQAKRKEIEDYNKEVRSVLNDKEGKEKAAEDALEQLLKGGKIEMG